MKKSILSLSAAFLVLTASAALPQDSVNGQYYKLFAPLTFYHSVAANQLSMNTPAGTDSRDCPQDETAEAIDAALMHVYLNRPDLVQVTESEQEQSGTLRQDIIEQPVMQQTTMVEQAMPMPEAPQADPVEVAVEKPKFWNYKGDGYLQFMQNYVSGNWYKGGESNYAAV